jgi:hypothetical protein
VILTFLNWCSSTTSDAKVVINEVDLGDFDAIELYNPTNQAVNLSGWEVIPYGSSGNPFFIGVIPSGATIPAHGYLLLREGGGTNTATVIYLGGPVSWNPDFDGSVVLADNSSTGVDFVRWGASSVSPPGGTNWTGTNPASPLPGKNLGRDPLGTDTDAGNDWCDQLASLGVQNTGCPARINVKIGANLSENYYLTPGLSMRASYAGVNAGPVKVSSTNQVPTIAAERLIYKVGNVPTSFTEMMALPNSQLDTTYWLPWYNNVDLDTQLRFANVSGSTASVHVYIGGEEMLGSPFTLLPGASTRRSFAGVNAGPVKIVSNQDIVAAERVIYKVNNLNTSFSEMMALPASQLDSTYWLPWYNNVELDTQLRFANISDQPASVQVYIGGEEMDGSPFTLQPGQSTRKSFVNVNAGPVRIVSDQDIVAAERVIYEVNGKNTSFTEMMALPNKSLDTTYWLPWYNNKELDTQLRFANTTDQTASVHVYIGGQEMLGSPFTLLPGQSTRKSFANVNDGPVQIVSDVPIVAAERLIYKVNNIATSFSEMMALPNSQLDTIYWLPWYNNVDLDTQLRFGVP